MKSNIIQQLQNLEQLKKIKVLYACEVGSRNWGFSEEDSDYDVRFIFIQPLNSYLSLEETSDVIHLQLGCKIDILGWDLKKALFLCKKSNISLMEWLHSNMIYHQYEEGMGELKKLAYHYFSDKIAIFHYLNMAKTNYKKISVNEQVNIKLLLNVIRPVVVSKWVQEKKTFPKGDFHALITEVTVDAQIRNQIQHIVHAKINGRKNVEKTEIEILMTYLHEEIHRLDHYVRELKSERNKETKELDRFFLKTLHQVWGGR